MSNYLKCTWKFVYYEVSTWETSRRCFPHGIALLQNIENFRKISKTLASVTLQINTAKHLMYQARLDEADQYFKAAIEDGKYLLQEQALVETEIHDLKHLIGSAHHNLSFVARCRGEFEQAIEYAKNQVRIYTDLFGEQSSQTLNAISCLGCTYLHVGNIEQSERLTRQVLDIRNQDLQGEFLHGPIGNLARILVRKKQFSEAIELFRKAECKLLANSAFGERHFQTGILYYNMALAYEQVEDSENANLCFGKAKVALQDSYINNHCAVDFKELRQRLGLAETV